MTYRAGIIGTGGVAGMGIYDGSADDIGTDPVDEQSASPATSPARTGPQSTSPTGESTTPVPAASS